MFLATSNKSRRLLHMSFLGQITVEELRHGIEDVQALLQELPAGLRVIVDLERLDHMDIGCSELLGKVMETMEKHGVELVVRIIPDPARDIGLNLISLFHYHHRPHVATFKTLTDARSLLGL
jgi:anti-anti-sigma regulatory factor